MSDQVQTPAPETAPKAETSAAPAPAADEKSAAWEKERSSLIDQLKGVQGQLANVLKERDTFSATLKDLEPKAKEADALRLKVEDYVRRDRELAIISKIRTATPHAGDLELRGVLAALHEGGKIDRYSEDAENTAKKAIDLLRSEAPNLFRQPTGASGSAAITTTAISGSRNKHPIYGG